MSDIGLIPDDITQAAIKAVEAAKTPGPAVNSYVLETDALVYEVSQAIWAERLRAVRDIQALKSFWKGRRP